MKRVKNEAKRMSLGMWWRMKNKKWRVKN